MMFLSIDTTHPILSLLRSSKDIIMFLGGKTKLHYFDGKTEFEE